MKYRFIFRPNCECQGVYECDWYGNATRLDGVFCFCGESQNVYAHSHADGRADGFQGYHLDQLEDNSVDIEMEFADDAAALSFAEWFDSCGFDPWRVDFIYSEDGEDREVYAQ